jgi:hypothetical protein
MKAIWIIIILARPSRCILVTFQQAQRQTFSMQGRELPCGSRFDWRQGKGAYHGRWLQNLACKISMRHETSAYVIVGMTKLAPSFTPPGQRQLTVLVLV